MKLEIIIINNREKTVLELSKEIKKRLKNKKASHILFWDLKLGEPPLKTVKKLCKENKDIIHAGLSLGTQKAFKELEYLLSDKMLFIDQNKKGVSWKATPFACIAKRELLENVKLDTAFESIQVAFLDLGYRSIMNGYLVFFDPKLAAKNIHSPKIPEKDKFVFLLRHFKKAWAIYVLARKIGTNILDYLAAKKSIAENKKPLTKQKITRLTATIGEEKISVVIPTLNRHEPLEKAIMAIKKQSLKPTEIIIIDQTPKEKIPKDYYKKFNSLNLRVFLQNKKGVATARNLGIKKAKGKYIFSTDDDCIIKKGTIFNHVKLLKSIRADASNGIVLINGKIPEGQEIIKISDVFASGNSLFTKKAFEETNCFDEQFGIMLGSDHDFGTRLYLDGKLVINNPSAIAIHNPEKTGGFREFGYSKHYRDIPIWKPLPIPSIIYYYLKFLTKKQTIEAISYSIVSTKVKKISTKKGIKKILFAITEIVLLPITILRIFWSIKIAKGMKK